MKITLALDSGAHSIFSKHVGKADGSLDYSYYQSEAFDKYLVGYAACVKGWGDKLDFHVTIDAIFNPQLTWDITKRLEKLGIKPLPIVHHGTPIEWIKKYVNAYDYLGVGGLGQWVTKKAYVDWGDSLFKYLGNTQDVKTHGFAMTAYPLLMRYPWYSVDSTTPFTFSRYGGLMVPRRKGDDFDFLSVPFMTPVSPRRPSANRHYLHLPDSARKQTDRWLTELGFDYAGVSESYLQRDISNIVFMYRFAEQLQQQKNHEFRYYLSGKLSEADAKTPELLDNVASRGVNQMFFLGTYFLMKPLIHFSNYKESKNEIQSIAVSTKNGRPRLTQHGVRSDSDPHLLPRRPFVRIR